MGQDKIYVRKMTPVRVIEDSDGIRIVFLESAQFYLLPNETSEFDSLLETLRSAIENSAAVEVITESIGSDVINDVRSS